MNEPVIQYPCRWSYRIIGTEEKALREAVSNSLAGREYKLALSNRSRNKTYLSMNVTVVVETQAMRDQIFKTLEKHPAVRFLL